MVTTYAAPLYFCVPTAVGETRGLEPTGGARPAPVERGSRILGQAAFVLHVETKHVPRQVGALLRLGPVDGAPLSLAAVRTVVASRLAELPSPAIVSYIPGVSRPRRLAGAELVETYPVLPLAEGVGLAAGLMSWSGQVGIGITVDPELVPAADRLPAALAEALSAYAETAPMGAPRLGATVGPP